MRAVIFGTFLASSVFLANAEVTRIELSARADVLGGKAFGAAGPYQKASGKVYFAIDPSNPHNQPVIDLDKAPRDAKGRVIFSADVYVLAPKDPARGNGVALFEVLNRGRKMMLGKFNHGTGTTELSSEADFGDGFLMKRGFTLVWVGWEFDVPKRSGVMGMDAPVASEQGHPLAGRLTTSFTLDKASMEFTLDDVRSYPPVDPASPENRLTVKAGPFTSQVTIPRSQWRFSSPGNGQDAPVLTLEGGGFRPALMYELSYQAQNPVVSGLGFAALRDIAAAFKYQQGALGTARFAYVFGESQSGRYLRDFLYQGFNADEQDRKVFDGAMPHIAGAARGDFNARFSQPNGRDFFAASLFPFLDLPQHDPISGKTDGLLSHMNPDAVPKIFYTDSSTEYWGGGRSAALTHTTLDGREDAKLPDNVRIYLLSGTQHGPAAFPPSPGIAQQRTNPNDYTWALRALLVAMDKWVREGAAPPPSRHPAFADQTLVPQKSLKFPVIPGLHSPAVIPGGYRADLPGPPSAHELPFLVPDVDADGNERAGIRLPDIAAPLATYTGWNFRSTAAGASDNIVPLTGSYVPFALTRAAREQNHDPRLSIEERYGSREKYLEMVKDAASKLINEGYMLSEDLTGVVDRAAAQWEYLARGAVQ